jgi:hypothetical protein
MLARAPLFALLLCAAPLGCAAAAPAGTGLRGVRAAERTRRRAVPTVKPQQATLRPSEHEPVLDEVADPEAKRLFQARVADAAVALAPEPSPPRVTAIALEQTAAGEATGMKPDGEITAATLAEGKRAARRITIAPGACETFIAQGGLGVIELDLFLTTGQGAEQRILAEDPGSGPIAVIGGHTRCFQNTLSSPLEAELHATVRRGAGVVLVRAYRRE